MIIFFALAKQYFAFYQFRIAEREVEVTGKYKSKMAQQETEVKILEINTIREKLIKLYNSYENKDPLNK